MRPTLVAVVVAALFSASAAAAPLDEAKDLLRQGKAQQAMDLLEKQLPQMAQDVEYNYLLGIASLDAGKPGEALFAFERALAIDPNHPQARAELARALIALTEYEAARRELLQVKQAPLPPEVAKHVDELLAELDKIVATAAEEKGATVVNGYIEGEVGFDSNINTAANANSIFIPVLNLPGTLSGFATAQGSIFEGVNAGISAQKRVSENVDIYGNIDGRFRYNSNKPDFALAALYGGAGMRITRGVDQYSIGLTQYDGQIDRFHTDSQTGIYGQWQREISRQDIVGLFAQQLRLNHPVVSFMNTDLTLVGASWMHAFRAKGDPNMRLSVYGGDDRERNNDPTIGRQLYGVKLSGDYKLREDIKLFGSVATQYSRYGGTNVWFLQKRTDWRHDFNLGAAYKFARQWTLTGQVSYLHNDSNTALNEFNRKQAMVTIRRDFF
jgi:tetratricopeptide (TPR) repeat protein